MSLKPITGAEIKMQYECYICKRWKEDENHGWYYPSFLERQAEMKDKGIIRSHGSCKECEPILKILEKDE